MRLIVFMICILFSQANSLNAQSSDPVKKAEEINEIKADRKMIDEKVAGFLVKAVDARMMDQMEGELAAKRGTTGRIRDYGKLMMKDQATLLAQLKELAIKKKVTIPYSISNDKREGHEELSGKTGKDFDKKFIRMMIIDHKRDLKLFRKAAKLKDKQVASFAKNNIALIEGHLNKIKAIKKNS